MSDRPLPNVTHGDPNTVAPNAGQPIPGVVHGDPNVTLGGDNVPTPDERILAGDQRRRSQEYNRSTSPGQQVRAGLRILARGVPGSNRVVPETPETQAFTAANPGFSTALTGAGGSAVLGPLSRLFSTATGPGFFRNLSGQAALGGGANIVNGLENGSEATPLQHGVTGALSAVPPALLGRAIAPAGMSRTTVAPNQPPPIPTTLPPLPQPPPIPNATNNISTQDVLRAIMNRSTSDIGAQAATGNIIRGIRSRARNETGVDNNELRAAVDRSSAPNPGSNELLRAYTERGAAAEAARVAEANRERIGPGTSRILSGVAGAGAGHLMGGPVGALYGVAGGLGTNEAVRALLGTQAGRNWLGRNIDPNNQAILNALSMHGGNQLHDAPTLGNR